MSHDDDSLPASEGWGQLASVWKSSTTEPLHLDPDMARSSRERSARLARRVVWRNARELLGSAFLIGAGLFEAATARTTVLRVAFGLMAAGALWVAVWMVRQGRNLTPPGPATTTSAHLAHEAAQLGRQIELLSNVRTHYLLPFAPSTVLILVSSLVTRWPPPGSTPGQWWSHLGGLLLVVVFVTAVFVGVDVLNRRAAGRLREQRDRLLADPASVE